MAGRGRGLTLPAWMTSGNLTTGSDAATDTPRSAPAAQPVQQSQLISQSHSLNASVAGPQPPRGPPPAVRAPPTQQPQQFSGVADAGHNQFSNNGMNSMSGMNGVGMPGYGSSFPGMQTGANPMMNQMPMNQGFMGYGMMMDQANPAMAMLSFQTPGLSMPTGMPPSMSMPLAMPMAPSAGSATASSSTSTNAAAGSNSLGDPNNDATCWSEHKSMEGKKYWYNRVSLVSTYDKPFCLKTPEERAIPPCTWKEYTNQGRVYYSNGKEST